MEGADLDICQEVEAEQQVAEAMQEVRAASHDLREELLADD